METLEIRLNRVMKELRRAGFVARRNVMACCRGCVDLKHEEGQPAFWTFGGQGHNVSVKGDEAYYAADPYKYYRGDLTVMFNHSGLTDENGDINDNGKLVLALLDDNGFVYDWDGSQWKCIEVNLDQSTASAHADRKRAVQSPIDSIAFV